MVMSMDTYADQTMSSSPLPSNEESTSPSAIMSSPSPSQQQESADDEHEDEHSKGSNQTVVAKHQEQHSAHLQGDNDRVTSSADERRIGSTGVDDQQDKMVVSRGSSFDGDKKLEMNVDDESNEESSMRSNSKFDPSELEVKLTQQAKTSDLPAESKVESSLVSQMREIVQGGSGRVASSQQQHAAERGQPKSSSDSLNNQNDNNTSKASLDSANGHKRTRHSRAHHCRHHHNHHHHHHHHHRHRQSIGGVSIAGPQVDGGLNSGKNTGLNPVHSHNQHHHHHHRHSNTSHMHPHNHHHHHHHSGQHHHHHHHHHDKNKGTSSKRNSIQRLTLDQSVCGQLQQEGKNESNSSVSSVSLTKRGQQSNNPDQSQPESGKSSGSPSDEQNLDPENQESSNNQPTNRDGHNHHHSHHHHCHHRSHKKRLVLDAGNNQPEAVAKSEDLSLRKKPLQDSSSGMNINMEPTKYHQHMHHHPHEHGHHHHHHHAHHHHHPHHHHNHAHSIHCAEDQGSSNKDLTDVSNIQAVADGAHQHHQRHHRHHHHHHGHHCRHNRHRVKERSDSKANISLRDSGKNLDTAGAEQVTERRFSSHSVAARKRRENEDKLTKNDQCVSKVEIGSQNIKDDEVINMEVSPKSDRKASQVVSNDQRASAIKDGLEEGADGEGEALKDSEVSGAGTSRKHDATCNFDQTIQGDQENVNSRGGSGANEEGHNRLSRQISSQSSKKSQKDSLHGAGQNQQDQRLNECAEPSLQVVGANQQSSRPKQVIESSVTADRRCRLCWCCCCPCSALNVREAPDRSVDKTKSTSGPPSSPTSKYPTAMNIPLDEIRSWGDSFDKLMKCTDGRKIFQDFLRCEYSEENILFWSACEELKKERDSKSIAAKARDIYEDYISILSSKEVSLDSRVRDVINNNIKKPTSNIFDEAQLQIYTLMHRDSYPRFINSGMYKKLAQITTSNSRKSSS